jgi:polysaccharide pyruvyl transferase WcaK-like protein
MRLMTGVLALCRLAGLTIIQVGLSYARLGPRLAATVAERVRQVHLHMVREQGSREYAETQGIRVDGVLPDLAYAAFSPSLIDTGTLRDSIGLSFRVDKTAGGTRSFARMAEVVSRRYASMSILCVAQVARDVEGMRVLAAALRDQGCSKVTVVDCHHDMAAAEEAYARCSAVFSNRLHALLLAAREGAVPVPVLTVGVDRKIERVWADLGLADVVRFIEDWDGMIPGAAESTMDRAIEMSGRLRGGLSESLMSTLPNFRTMEQS